VSLLLPVRAMYCFLDPRLLSICLACTCCVPLPACLQSRVHPKTRTPVVSVLFCGAVSAVLALFVPLEELSDLTSMGALFAFCVVSAGVLFRWGGAGFAAVYCIVVVGCAAGVHDPPVQDL
jgi:amino acid transporter